MRTAHTSIHTSILAGGVPPQMETPCGMLLPLQAAQEVGGEM